MQDYRDYWEHNIDRWSELYLEISHGHEKLDAPSWLGAAYNATIAKYEARLMRERFAMTLRFIDSHINTETVFADVGCGTGIFVVEALKRGARVVAIDFAQRALDITKTNVEKYAPNGDVTYHRLDVQVDELPKSEVAIVMGVAPYLADLDGFLDRVLTSTELVLCQFVDPHHWANRIRRLLPVLNVRRLIFHARDEVDACYSRRGWKLVKRSEFASGYVDMICSPKAQEDSRLLGTLAEGK